MTFRSLHDSTGGDVCRAGPKHDTASPFDPDCGGHAAGRVTLEAETWGGIVRKNLVMGVAAVGLLVIWTFLLVAEIVDVLDESGTEVVRSDLRTWVMTLLTGLLGSALALSTSADDPVGESRLGALPQLMPFKGERLAPLMALLYALIYVVGVVFGLLVVLLNEEEASALLLAVSSGGLGVIATGVAAWMGLTFSTEPPPAA